MLWGVHLSILTKTQMTGLTFTQESLKLYRSGGWGWGVGGRGGGVRLPSSEPWMKV